MKIIKEGVIPEKQIMRFECHYCGCIFECERGEAKIYEGRCNETIYIHDCPTCGREAYEYIKNNQWNKE